MPNLTSATIDSGLLLDDHVSPESRFSHTPHVTLLHGMVRFAHEQVLWAINDWDESIEASSCLAPITEHDAEWHDACQSYSWLMGWHQGRGIEIEDWASCYGITQEDVQHTFIRRYKEAAEASGKPQAWQWIRNVSMEFAS